ncbi:carotenoid ester lipase precursor [Epithele typhae]|uniref:carotenoid ester lipase precursor n=1 Tax=Epithele typhae TaxID=378194 RepID=UPI002008BDB4|nr:carotenoid ester lipase precursor [Epithele typhae]KAH9930418.1 carotenoid ester lipase precursor [Epithele typhae]
MPRLNSFLKAALSTLCLSQVTKAQPDATVQLDNATVIGVPNVNFVTFFGIPFALPPVGDLRLQIPWPNAPYTGTINATSPGTQCWQKMTTPPKLPPSAPPAVGVFLQEITTTSSQVQSEDCELELERDHPCGAKEGDNLPVAAWIFGGGNEFGSNLQVPGENVVNRSVLIEKPIIFVSMNYRLNGFGFLGGREVQEAGVGNLGLHDQREALRWIQKYIRKFGGDPTKVTIWGESAGGEGVAMQMLANDGDSEGLFRGAWMESGSTTFTGDFAQDLQPNFDTIVQNTGCANQMNKLMCLRSVDVNTLVQAISDTEGFLSFSAIASPYAAVRADGKFVKKPPQKLVLSGSIANVPFVLGSNQDEGTLFSVSSLNLTTEAQAQAYIHGNYYSKIPQAKIAELFRLYPADPAAGSPFRTGHNFTITPVYKQISAFQGDLLVNSPRRFLLNRRGEKQGAWTFLSERSKIPGLGAAHTTEVPIIYGGGDLTDYLIRFVNDLDPNGAENSSAMYWPKWTKHERSSLTLLDGNVTLVVQLDTFREEAIELVTELSFTQNA